MVVLVISSSIARIVALTDCPLVAAEIAICWALLEAEAIVSAQAFDTGTVWSCNNLV